MRLASNSEISDVFCAESWSRAQDPNLGRKFPGGNQNGDQEESKEESRKEALIAAASIGPEVHGLLLGGLSYFLRPAPAQPGTCPPTGGIIAGAEKISRIAY